MRVYISTDAEGITGVFKLSQVIPGDPSYEYFRTMMTSDVNAAIRGAFNAGATEVYVNDSHNMGDNLRLDTLDPRAHLCSGFDKPLIMAEGLERGFDAAMLIGYHSRKGARGTVSHTFFYGALFDARINGVPFGEADFVAHVAGHFGTPLVFLSGDDCVTAYAHEKMPGVETVAVKEYIGNNTALCRNPAETAPEIEAAVERAVRNCKNVKPLTLQGPVTLELTFSCSTQAELACTIGFEPGDVDNQVRFTADDYFTVYQAFMKALKIGAFFKDR